MSWPSLDSRLAQTKMQLLLLGYSSAPIVCCMFIQILPSSLRLSLGSCSPLPNETCVCILKPCWITHPVWWPFPSSCHLHCFFCWPPLIHSPLCCVLQRCLASSSSSNTTLSCLMPPHISPLRTTCCVSMFLVLVKIWVLPEKYPYWLFSPILYYPGHHFSPMADPKSPKLALHVYC